MAASLTGSMITIQRMRGRLGEALKMVDRMVEHTRAAGLGPATQLAGQGYRLQILAANGEHQQVLDEVLALRPQLAALPDQRAANEPGASAIWHNDNLNRTVRRSLTPDDH